MKYEFEKTTAFAASRDDVVIFLQDAKQFLTASGGTEPESIKYDETKRVWHGTSKDGIPLLPKPAFTAACEPQPDGAKWVVDAGMGIQMTHVWSVEAKGEKECAATEKTILEAPPLVFHASKMALPGVQEKNHKSLQEHFAQK